MTHELKTLPQYWDAVQRGEKTFEVRRDDRGFQKGDVLELVRHYGGFVGRIAFREDLSDNVGVGGRYDAATYTLRHHARRFTGGRSD